MFSVCYLEILRCAHNGGIVETSFYVKNRERRTVPCFGFFDYCASATGYTLAFFLSLPNLS